MRIPRIATPKYKPSDEVDFVIVGSGAAGGILAKELSANGFRVVVLEQGPYLTEADFTHDEVKVLQEDLLTNHPELQPNTYRETPDQTAKRQRAVFYGRLVGGTSVHFTANFWRFHEIDFVERSKIGPVPSANAPIGRLPTPTSSLTTPRSNGTSACPGLPIPVLSIRRVPSRIRCRRFQ